MPKVNNLKEMNKKIIGFLLMIISIITLILYTWLLFFSPIDWTFYGFQIRWWVIAISIEILTIAALAIVVWAGYILFTTPTPQPIEDWLEKERTKGNSK